MKKSSDKPQDKKEDKQLLTNSKSTKDSGDTPCECNTDRFPGKCQKCLAKEIK